VAWLPPELELGEEPELKPPELEPEFVELDPEFAEPEFAEPEFAEPEFAELEPEPVEPEPELAEVEPEPLDVLDVLVVWLDPGRARASAPAVTTLATVTVVVADRTLARPRSLAATAWRIPSFRRALLISLILRSRTRKSLHEPSGRAMSPARSSRLRRPRLPRQHDRHLKRCRRERSRDAVRAGASRLAGSRGSKSPVYPHDGDHVVLHFVQHPISPDAEPAVTAAHECIGRLRVG
jgi:hypothetical protein